MRKRHHHKNATVSGYASDALPSMPGSDPTKFRERSHEISRIEGFSDAVFAFAVTLMVVSLEVPRNYSELMHAMHGFFAFAACFASLFLIWYYQHLFFRRYGLQDGVTLVLNAVLLFVVLFYVYPLKFLFTLLSEQIMGNPIAFDQAFNGATGLSDVTTLMLVYSLGYLAVFAVFVLLQRHAYSKRQELGLNDIECFDTRIEMWSYFVSVCFSLVSIFIALSPMKNAAFYSGMVYFLMGPAFAVFWVINKRRRRALTRHVRAT